MFIWDFHVQQNVDYKCKSAETPYVELNGVGMSDSSTIIQKLGEKFEKNLDAGLDNEQKNISHAMSSMIENHLQL